MRKSNHQPQSRYRTGARSIVLLTVLRWASGFALSLLVIWAITSVGTENFNPKIWSEQLHRNVPAPGWIAQNRNEAWADTKFGEMGLRGTPAIAGPSVPKIFLWGDSFVEAVQVVDQKKMHRQLNDLLTKDGNQETQVIPLGQRFQSFADYVLQMPLYEKAISPCALHVIYLQSLEDVLPDKDQETRISLFLSEPEFHFVKYDNEYREIESPMRENSLHSLAYRLRLQFFLRTKKQIFQIAKLEGLRFSLGEQHLAARDEPSESKEWDRYLTPEWSTKEAPAEAWEFLIDSLRNATTHPILIVYAPVTPTLYKGVTVERNPEENLVKVFSEICRERNLGFVNMEQSFLEYHRTTGKFPRGFDTSRPWEGHNNGEGHRLVAAAIHNWIKENQDAVHPD